MRSVKRVALDAVTIGNYEWYNAIGGPGSDKAAKDRNAARDAADNRARALFQSQQTYGAAPYDPLAATDTYRKQQATLATSSTTTAGKSLLGA